MGISGRNFPTQHGATFIGGSVNQLLLANDSSIYISRVLFTIPMPTLYNVGGISALTRVSPFHLIFFFACKRNKANLDPFHLCFTISL
jgi:hypothetical protein